ncbi:hypothetical protein [Aeromicrobium sp. CTD01-1L150]|uniref:hypothetical protein n=1 Tax=Aeromicrobium sp. CTD01-1L150 TaxID=3341830 RepID=UPI0035C19A38
MNKLLLVAAGVAGYVLGARAGRERYEQIRDQSTRVWNSPTVQHGVDEAAKHAASAAGGKVTEAATTAGSAVTEKVSETLSKDDGPEDPLADLADADRPPKAVADPAAPRSGAAEEPLPRSTPTSASPPPPTARDLDPNKNL